MSLTPVANLFSVFDLTTPFLWQRIAMVSHNTKVIHKHKSKMSQKSANISSDNKIKQKERQKVKNIKKKQTIPRRVEKAEVKRTQKVSEKYLKEELQVEKSLKEHLQNQPIDDEYEKQRQAEIDFFCDPYSTIPLIIEKIKSTDNDSERGEEEEEVEAHSTHSNESSPNTHMASTYIGHEHESVVAKFELTRITFDEMKLLFYPKSEPRGEFLIIFSLSSKKIIYYSSQSPAAKQR
jgi:hypothetical protein